MNFVILEKGFQKITVCNQRFFNPLVLNKKLRQKEGFLQKKVIESCYWCHYENSSQCSVIHSTDINWSTPMSQVLSGTILGAGTTAIEAIYCLLLRKRQILNNRYISLGVRSGGGEGWSRARGQGCGWWAGQTSMRRQHFSRDLNQAREQAMQRWRQWRISFQTKGTMFSKNSKKAEWLRKSTGGRGGQGASHGPDDTGLIGWW